MHLGLEAVGVGRGDEDDHDAIHVCHFGSNTLFRCHTRTRRHLLAISTSIRTHRNCRRTTHKAIIPVPALPVLLRIWTPSTRSPPGQIGSREDAAHAFPMTYKRRMVGQTISHPTASGFRTSLSRSMPQDAATAEGGTITTDDNCRRTLPHHGATRHQQGRLETVYG